MTGSTETTTFARIEIAGTSMDLLPNRMAWWPEQNTLFLADSHFGKAATFRHSGIPVPSGTTQAMLATLTEAIAQYQAQRIVVLGDLIHSSVRAAHDFEEDLRSWRDQHASLPITLIKGNHDRHNNQLFPRLDIHLQPEGLKFGPFTLVHDLEKWIEAERAAGQGEAEFLLAGHLHPAVRIAVDGTSTARLPCFWLTTNSLTFPAFGLFTGCATIDSKPDDRVFPIADGQIFSFMRSKV